jgi:3-deoxy-manno-octulosonate cytidylyltransferase (CMP-KDO synthetase)
MVSRVAAMAAQAAEALGDAQHVVATDDGRIESHCRDLGIPVVMTDPDLPSGTDRALAAADAMGAQPDVVVNLQGDSPFTPPAHVIAVAEAARDSGADAATPYVRLSWDALDAFRAHKAETPFSGTTLVHGEDGRALWFSKNLIPAMRKEAALRSKGDPSPVCRHIGLYAYRMDALRRYVSLPEGRYEQLEGLEQLRLLENGMSIQCVEVSPGQIAIPGIDTSEDVALAERLVAEHGDPLEA